MVEANGGGRRALVSMLNENNFVYQQAQQNMNSILDRMQNLIIGHYQAALNKAELASSQLR